jgi:hypothetical protein
MDFFEGSGNLTVIMCNRHSTIKAGWLYPLNS